MTPKQREAAFSSWLKNKKKPSGEEYSQVTLRGYIRNMVKNWNQFRGQVNPIVKESPYDYDNAKEFEVDGQKIINAFLTKYKKIDADNDGGIKLYAEFLKYLENGGKITNNKLAFKEWLKTAKRPTGENYAAGTQNSYRSAFDRASEIFGSIIKPYASLYEVDDIDEYDNKVREIKADQEFDSYNSSNGNTAFSQCIELYRQFLQEKNCKNKIIATIDKPYNRIAYGAPGTGKSYSLNEDVKKHFDNENIIRVTFHPDYSYANFVGTYKPFVKDGKDITYKYVPGPFMLAYVKAQKSDKPVVLVIEEINRANTAAVFGDIFQLLDRKNDGTSEYPIVASMDIQSYLKDELEQDLTVLSLPSNLYLWATMNSADQGVFPMDTAFKRRWSFEYTEVDQGIKELPNTPTAKKWNDLRVAINDVLAEELKVNEDKLMGVFFLKNSELINDSTFNTAFANKVLMYLYDDAARQKRGKLFDEKYISRFSKLSNGFLKGEKIFSPAVYAKLNNENITE